ncbi:hypothetical protein BCR25_02840 [Enterococcus termitis]|uniref:Uncharacterized protein n=1 Tax=Enterococcus termitis TaxID=332950 RepID=A0A1E5H7E8_9ENTE|nr:hypothetical protein BCR25_02840 [Enterococcus termitis]OJG96716.1 hypothetical protein RV18_GL001922 [Enterococcus termitis]
MAIVLAAVACVLLLFFNLNKNNAQEMNKENETVEFSEQIISSSLEKSPELSPEEKKQLDEVAPEGYELVE